MNEEINKEEFSPADKSSNIDNGFVIIAEHLVDVEFIDDILRTELNKTFIKMMQANLGELGTEQRMKIRAEYDLYIKIKNNILNIRKRRK